jgi:selenocysteine lyase/cysteine desulfurase
MSGAVSLLAAVEYLEGIGGYSVLTQQESGLNEYVLEQVRKLPSSVRLIGGKQS